MGAGMDKILPGLYLGSKTDSEDIDQLEKYQITHILSIHDDAKEGAFKVCFKSSLYSLRDDDSSFFFKNIKYLCIQACDIEYQDLQQYFSKCFGFIHDARNEGGNVLVHWSEKF